MAELDEDEELTGGARLLSSSRRSPPGGLYSSLWQSCDELGGDMDASQYKDCVLVLLFVKYVSDKYADWRYAQLTIPPGASFQDMVTLQGKPDIGDRINKQILGPLAKAHQIKQGMMQELLTGRIRLV